MILDENYNNSCTLLDAVEADLERQEACLAGCLSRIDQHTRDRENRKLYLDQLINLAMQNKVLMQFYNSAKCFEPEKVLVACRYQSYSVDQFLPEDIKDSSQDFLNAVKIYHRLLQIRNNVKYIKEILWQLDKVLMDIDAIPKTVLKELLQLDLSLPISAIQQLIYDIIAQKVEQNDAIRAMLSDIQKAWSDLKAEQGESIKAILDGTQMTCSDLREPYGEKETQLQLQTLKPLETLYNIAVETRTALVHDFKRYKGAIHSKLRDVQDKDTTSISFVFAVAGVFIAAILHMQLHDPNMIVSNRDQTTNARNIAAFFSIIIFIRTIYNEPEPLKRLRERVNAVANLGEKIDVLRFYERERVLLNAHARMEVNKTLKQKLALFSKTIDTFVNSCKKDRGLFIPILADINKLLDKRTNDNLTIILKPYNNHAKKWSCSWFQGSLDEQTQQLVNMHVREIAVEIVTPKSDSAHKPRVTFA